MSYDPDQLELFDHWPNAIGSLYITVAGYTKAGVQLTLQDSEGQGAVTLEVGDRLFTHGGSWEFAGVAPHTVAGDASHRKALFRRP
jgi:hypothetical protein